MMKKNLTKPWFIGRGIYELARSFVRAMYFWAKSGFKIVPYYTFWKRRLICKVCTQGVGHRCPVCGCFLWAICKLSSSHCKNWDEADTFHNLFVHPSIQPTED
jgi:hypothetical protein